MGRLRHLEGERPWSKVVGHFEQRMLSNLDALVSLAYESSPPGPADREAAYCGRDETELPTCCDVTVELERYHRENPMDVDRAFVRSFVLGCLRGEEPVRAAVMGLRRAQPHTLPAHARALALAPNPAIRQAMEKLCFDESPRLVRLGVDVLRLRREASFAPVAMLLSHSDVAVRRSAAITLATTEDREAAARLLAASLDNELDGTVEGAIAEALCRLDHPLGLMLARERLMEERKLPGSLPRRARATFVRLLALAGAPCDLELLLGVAERPSEIALLGWFGHVGAAEHLLAVLDEPAPSLSFGALDETRLQAAARALQRITGALDPADSPARLGARPDAVDPGPARWRQWWAERGSDLKATVKLRAGRPYTPQATLDELDQDGVPQDVRRIAELEIALLSGGVHLLEVNDWLPRQSAAIASLRAHFAQPPACGASRLHAPGEWLAKRVGQRRPGAVKARHSAGRAGSQPAQRRRLS